MTDFNLGTAKGKIEIDGKGAVNDLRQVNSGIDDLGTKSNNSRGNLLALSGALAAAGAAGLAAFGYVVKVAAGFEKQMSSVQAVSGATAKEMESVRAKALQLGADTSFSAGEAAGAIEELVKAGLSVEDVLNGAADATVALAAAGEIDLPAAATIAANAMNQFGLAAQDLPHLADLIAGAANTSAIDVGQFGMAMQQAGATANLVGLSFDDMALAIVALGDAGIVGSDAGTSIKTFLSNLQPVTQGQIDLFDKLGLTMKGNATGANTLGNAFFDAEGNIKSMSEISGVLAGALEGQSSAQQQATLEAIFGSDAVRAAAIIAGEGAAGFDTLSESINGISAADVAATRLDNFDGSMEQLKGSFETFMIQAGTPFLDSLRGIVDWVTQGVNALGEMDPEIRNLILTVVAAVSGFALLAGGAGIAANALSPVISGISSLIGVVAKLSVATLTNPFFLAAAALAALAAAAVYAYNTFEPFRNVVDQFADFFQKLYEKVGLVKTILIGVAAAITPAIAAFVAIAAVIYVLYQNFDVVRQVVDAVLAAIVSFVDTVYAYFTTYILPVLQQFADFFMVTILPAIMGFIDSVVPAITGFVQSFIAVVQGIIDWITNTFIPAVSAGWEQFKTTITELWNWFDKNVLSTFSALVALLIAVFQRIGDFVQYVLLPVFETAWAFFAPVVEGVFNIIVDLVTGAFDIIVGLVGFFVDAFMIFWNLFGDNIVDGITIAFNIVKGIVEFVLGLIRGIAQTLTGLITLDWDTFTKGLGTLWTTIWDAIKLTVETVIAAVKLAIETFIDAIILAWDLFWNGLSLVVDTAWTLITTAVQVIIDGVTAVWDGFTSALGTAWQGLWDGITSAIDTAWGVIKGIIEKITGGIQTAIDLLKDLNPLSGDVVDLSGAVGQLPKPGGKGKSSTGGSKPPVNSYNGRIVSGLTLSWLGERGPEAVIPLTNWDRALEIMNASGLTDKLMGTYAGTMGSASTSDPIAAGSGGAGGSSTAVAIENYNVYDGTDVDSLLMQAEYLVQAGRM